MKLSHAIIATTLVDKENEVFQIEALESMVRQTKNNYIIVMDNHDPRKPPVGRIVSAQVVTLGDSEYAVDGIIETFEDGDTPESFKSDGRRIVTRVKETNTVVVEYDKSHMDEKGDELLTELQRIPELEIVEYGKKALDPVSVLIISAGIFTIGGIANGFFSKLGEDLYEFMKKPLVHYFTKATERERLLQFTFGVIYHNMDIEINILLTNPTEKAINGLFRFGFKDLDIILRNIDFETHEVGKVVFNYKNGKITLNYMVRSDGVPLLT